MTGLGSNVTRMRVLHARINVNGEVSSLISLSCPCRVSRLFVTIGDCRVIMTVSIFSSTVVLIASGALLILYLAYRAVLPRPISGIPHNRDAASKLLGDVPEMLTYVRRHKRMFVSLPSKSSVIRQ